MKRLLLSLALCVSTIAAMAQVWNIQTTAQAWTSDVYQIIGEMNLEDVTSLTFKPGSTINSYDIMIIRNRMPKLTYLDMSEVSIVANDHEYYTGYHSENDVLGPYAFYEVSNLETVILPKSITSLGSYAFANCSRDVMDGMDKYTTGLKTVVFPDGARVTRIGNSAFSQCYNLQSINFPDGLIEIQGQAFSSCGKLTSLVFPKSLKTIGWGAFSSCWGLTSVKFSPYKKSQLRVIESNAFAYCSSLLNFKMPSRVRTIGESAFRGCRNLPSINIPGGVLHIYANAFAECNNLNDVYPETIWPISIDQTTFSTYQTANVHIIPWKWSKREYYWSTEWNQFLNLHTYSRGIGTRGDNEEDEDDIISTTVYFYLPNDVDYVFEDGDLRVDGEPDADFYYGSGLIVEGEEPQKLGEVHVMGKSNYVSNIYMGPGGSTGAEGEYCSFIGNNNITAKKLYIDLTLETNRWHFISFPFKVRRSDIICGGNYVFRYYDSSTRALNGTTGWKDIPENEEFLYPGRGYIFQTDFVPPAVMMEYDEEIPTIRIPVDPEYLDFSGANKSITIQPYPSNNASNASWNFLGNPYPCYFDLDETDYEGPITVWNGTGYESVRKGDDVYHFSPHEGFFIQKPDGTDAMLFQAKGRHTYSQWATIKAEKAAASRAAETSGRQLINLTLSDGSYTDKTRVVFNPNSSESYEIGTDATKFIAAKVTQLYSVDSKAVQYAINERPMGEVRLGYVAAKGGEMTISTSRMDTPVAIYDKVMDITFDLSQAAYTFTTEAGTFNDRFLLVSGGNKTGISTIDAEGSADAPVYSLDGRRVEQTKANRVYITNGMKVIKK